VEPELRTLLREKAEEVRLDGRIPGPVLRRSRRRRALTGVLAVTLAVGAVGGVFVGARLLSQETAPEPRGARPAGTPAGFYPFIYPETQEQLDATTAEVAQGSMPMWSDPRGAAVIYAVNELGWEMNHAEVSVRGDDPITAFITNPVFNEAAGAQADLRTAVYLAKVPGAQDPPVYAVLAAQAEDIELEPAGPDEEVGEERSLTIGGRVGFVPQGAKVELTVEWSWINDLGGRMVERASDSVVPDADGRFRFAPIADEQIGPSSLISVALVDGSGRTLAVTSSRLATPLAGQGEAHGSAPAQVGPPEQIPPPVAATRDRILDAAVAMDWAALRALIPERGFTFTYGGERDPIAYWQKLESRGHVPVIGDILPMVLGTEPASLRDTYIWPAPAAEDPAEWDAHDIDVLRQIHSEEDIRLFQEIGLYTGWRVGIERDGTWVFFVSGD
jgi:hypothetical protein